MWTAQKENCNGRPALTASIGAGIVPPVDYEARQNQTHMKLVCPNCNCANENPAFVEGLCRCAGCGQWFDPSVLDPSETPQAEPQAGVAPAAPPPVQPALTPRRVLSKAARIRRNANMLSAVGGLFAGVGSLAGILTAVMAGSGEGSNGGLVFCGASLAAGLWFYLIGKIVHIRANTEK